MTFEEIKHTVVSVAVAVIAAVWGKGWHKKLATWFKAKLKSWVNNFGRNWKRTWLVKVLNLIIYPTRTQIIKSLEYVLYLFNIDRVIILFPHNPTKNKVFQFWGGDKFSCYAEVHTIGIEPTYKRNQNILGETLSDMLHHLQNKGRIVVECVESVPEEVKFMKGIMISLGAKSAYINVYFDAEHKVAFILILGSEHECITIEDFSNMDSVGRRIAADFGIIKPKK